MFGGWKAAIKVEMKTEINEMDLPYLTKTFTYMGICRVPRYSKNFMTALPTSS